MVDRQHEAKFEAADVKMVGTQDVKMVHTQHAATIEAEEDPCKDKEGKNEDNQHAKATEGEDIKMVEAKADAKNSEAQGRKEDVCQKKYPTSIDDKDMQMVDKEDACEKEDKEGKNEDCQKEKEDQNAEKADDVNNKVDSVKIVDKEDACQKEDKERKDENSHDAKAGEGRGLQPTRMSEANPTPATEDPPLFVNGESAASDKKNNAEKYEIEDSREAALTSNNADEVKNGCENSTEGEDANIMEANDTEGRNSGCDNVVSAEDVKMVDTQHEANVEAVNVKMVDTQHEAKIEAADVKVVGTQDVKMVHTQHAATIEAEETACKDKEGKNGDNQHAKVTEGEDITMIGAKADTRNSEAQDRTEDACQKKNPTSIEDKGMQMVGKEDTCKKEDNVGKNEDCLDAKVANVDEMKIVEAKTYVRNADVQGDEKKEEMEDKVEEKKNNTNFEDDGVNTVDKEVACQKEDEGNNEDKHDSNVAGDQIMKATAKTDAGNTEVEENAKNTEEEKNNADIETELIFLDKDDACVKEHKKVKIEDIQDAKESEGEDMKIVQGNTDAIIPEAIENTKNGDMEDNVEENKNDSNIDVENVIMADKENACQNKDKEDANAAEGEGIVMVEAKSDAGNAGVKENEKKEEKEEQNAEKADGVNNKPDNMKIVDKEDACQKEEKERMNENNHSAKAAEGEEIMVVEAKPAVVHAEAKENGKKEEDENTTKEKQKDNKEGSIYVEKQDEDKMGPVEVHKQDGLTQEEKDGFDKHEMSDREETVKESQEVLKREEKGNVDKQEVDDTEQNVMGRHEELEVEERVASYKREVAKGEQDGTAEKQEGERPDVNVAAENKEKQDVKLIAEEKDKTQDVKVAAEKIEEEEVNKNVAFENNAEIVIEMGVSEKYEEMDMNGKTTVDKQEGKEDNQIDDTSKKEGQMKGTKRSNADMEEAENGSASKIEKDGDGEVEEAGESDNNMEENKNDAPKSKKARIVREEDKEKDKKQQGSKSREAKELLNSPSLYSLDRPVRAKKTVERLVEVIEKEPSGSFIVEKGFGTPLKKIPGVSYRVSRKKPADLKFLHQILFGKFGKAADFKDHILEFSGFVWHESDEKHRAKAKEKLDKCSKETLFDLCHLLAIPVSTINPKKEDIATKLLDFIAEPHANDDFSLSDDQGSNSRKRKRGGSAAKDSKGTHKRSRKNLHDEHTSRKRQQKYSEFESDEEGAEEGHMSEHMKSDSEENKDDGGEADGEEEDSYGTTKLKATQKSMVEKAAERKAITGNVPMTAPAATLSKCTDRVSSSSKSSKDKQSSAEDPNSRKSKPITPKLVANSQKVTYQRRSSGQGLSTSKGKSGEREKTLTSMDELQNTIIEILKKINFNTTTYSDVLKLLEKHYKMDLSSRKEAIKSMIYDELVKLAEADED